MKKLFFLAAALAVAACSGPKKARSTKNEIEKAIASNAVFERGHTGFCLVDPENGRVLAEQNSRRGFTPASCTKILTLAASLAALGDSLTAFEWQSDGATVFVRGAADPTFLHDRLGRFSPAFSVLKNRPEKTVCLVERPFDGQRFGAGWCWDDFGGDFQAERAAFPLFSGLIRAAGAEPKIWPPRLAAPVQPSADPSLPKTALARAEFSNRLLARPEAVFSADFEQFLPIRWEDGLAARLLEDTLRTKKVRLATRADLDFLSSKKWKRQAGAPLDTVLRAMMLPSDNFLAEQLLLAASGAWTDTLATEKAIEIASKKLFSSLQMGPTRWVDGSGLSRYNLFSPLFLTALLQKMWAEQPRERLLNFFPAGGQSGTIAEFYAPPPGEPAYVFAKTGTLGGVHCLSGFLRAKSGKWLVFSFMHDGYAGPSKPYKVEMERIFESLRERF